MNVHCALPDCGTPIYSTQIFCYYHWFLLPAEMQTDLIEMYTFKGHYPFEMMMKDAIRQIQEVERQNER